MVKAELEKSWRECGAGEPVQALVHLRSLDSMFTAQNDPALLFRYEWLQGWILFQLGEAEQAFSHAQTARKLSKTLDNASQAIALTLAAWILSNLGLSDESYSVARAAVNLAESSADDFALALALHVSALIAWMGGDIPLSLNTSQRAISIARTLPDTHVLCWCLFGRGCMVADEAREARQNGDDSIFMSGHEDAIALTSESLALSYANSDSWARRVSLTNRAEYCCYIGRFSEAHDALEEWKTVKGPTSNRRSIQYLKTYAEILQRQGRIGEAREYCEQAVQLTAEIGTADLKHLCTKALSEIHEAMGDFENALQLHKRFFREVQQFEGEKVKCRARVAEILYEAEKLRQLTEETRRMAEQSQRDALTDPLTGVANRRRLEQGFDSLIASGNRFAVVFADLDHFKAINDNYSHAIGDAVIKAFADMLSKCFSASDLIARIGGEEFVILVRDASMHDLPLLGENLLKWTRSHGWARIAPGLQITTSLGLAGSKEAIGREALLALADARLYLAKTAGRDRYAFEGGLPSISYAM
ncbi:sensor domain-containing diguanylate cyclase [Rhizobium leguminosarum]|uniref:sensor domain-containing diguanylate cyclase n=1 Tax=Rhizobium leguminosarum TaxID=384 RepID=UPI001441DCA7|nr:tetratricopeptide repeat-containing diguanylate cyclase [Rhizobium leguminosarum]MBY5868651.1 GGDEF domain-containing protein [Rhizobium leguminosarum]NKM08023.1 diguanylate cyclase [Rhizobium leguminosarum bv. viciae]